MNCPVRTALEHAIEWMEWAKANLDAHPDVTLLAVEKALATPCPVEAEVERDGRTCLTAQSPLPSGGRVPAGGEVGEG